jgi:thiol-disulfide isomerase/thioredoxin
MKQMTILFFIMQSAFALQVGDKAIDFKLLTINVDNSEQKESILYRRNSEDFLLIMFYQSHCIPSRNSFPSLEKLKLKYKNDLAIKLVNSDYSMAELKDYFIEFRSITKFPVAIEDDYKAVRKYTRKYTPTFFLLNKKNRIIHKMLGTPSAQALSRFHEVLSLNQGAK